MFKIRSCFGPSTLVTAAFIGPGTLTTCTLAGVDHGYDLLWALAFAALATIVLQEMAARLGWISGEGLGEAIRHEFSGTWSRPIAFGLVISAILIGNAAFEAGNLSGAIIGLELLLPEPWLGATAMAWLAGGIVFGLLLVGRYQWLERILIALVLLMSVCFLATAMIVQPDGGQILQGFRPQPITSENFLLIMGVIGTTVVPYNLFLHASTISKKWKSEASIRDLRLETTVAVLLGILISMLIIITAAATRDQIVTPESGLRAKDFAVQLQPLFGSLSQTLLGIGFFAAGLSSALTAPLAAAYAVRGLFGWTDNDRQPKFQAVWMTILAIGLAVSLTGASLVYIIKFAQVANAIVLPLIGVFLLYLANRQSLMKKYKNGIVSNVLSGCVLLILFALSIASLVKVVQFFA